MTDWRRRVAHMASPWEWSQPAFVMFGVAVVALSVAVLVQAATGPSSTGGKMVWVGLWAVGIYLLYLRPLARAVKRRKGRPSRRAP